MLLLSVDFLVPCALQHAVLYLGRVYRYRNKVAQGCKRLQKRREASVGDNASKALCSSTSLAFENFAQCDCRNFDAQKIGRYLNAEAFCCYGEAR